MSWLKDSSQEFAANDLLLYTLVFTPLALGVLAIAVSCPNNIAYGLRAEGILDSFSNGDIFNENSFQAINIGSNILAHGMLFISSAILLFSLYDTMESKYFPLFILSASMLVLSTAASITMEIGAEKIIDMFSEGLYSEELELFRFVLPVADLILKLMFCVAIPVAAVESK